MHLVRPDNHQGSPARILRKADPIFGNSYLYRGVSHYSSPCIHLRQAKTPSGCRTGWLFYCNHRIHHPPKPKTCLGQCTVWRPVSYCLRLIRRSARCLDFAFEQCLWILQDSLCHRYGNRPGQRWWIHCIVHVPGEDGSILLDRLQDHLFADVHGDRLHLPLCGWTLVREQAKARWEEGSSTR